MSWRLEFDPRAQRELSRLDRPIQREIARYLDALILGNPRDKGKPLSGPLSELWRWRVRDWRIIGRVQGRVLLVTIVEIGHRSEIYRK